VTASLSSRMRRNLADTRARWKNRRFARLAPPIGREWLLFLGVGVIATAVAACALDVASVSWASGLPEPIRSLARRTTDFGMSGWELYPAAVAILVMLAGDWTRVAKLARLAWAEVAALAVFLFVGAGGAGIAVNILKSLFGRGRPWVFDTVGGFSFDPFELDAAYQSFPSGHATTCGAVAMFGAIVFPRWRWAIVVVAGLLASTRVIVGAHYPSDVVAGFLFGAVFTFFLARTFAGSGYAVVFSDNGCIVARTGAIRRLFRQKGGWQSAWRGLAAALRPT